MAMASGSSDSESPGDEEWERFREAVWDSAPQRAVASVESSDGYFSKSKLPSAVSSIRQKVRHHGQDHNELQTTPEFRAHIAKKLGSILDSSITILEHMPGHVKTCTKALETGDDSFRFFSSSIPGISEKPDPLPLQSRQLQHSSSSAKNFSIKMDRCCQFASIDNNNQSWFSSEYEKFKFCVMSAFFYFLRQMKTKNGRDVKRLLCQQQTS